MKNDNWRYDPTAVLARISQAMGCHTKDVEGALSKRFGRKLNKYNSPAQRIDEIRKHFNPGEGNDLVAYIYSIAGPTK